MTKKEFIIEIYSAGDGDILLWKAPNWLPPIPTKGELVRCKDCKWWSKENDSLQGRCALLQMYPTGEWYCANAERKEEFDCNDCYYSMQNCNDISICCEDETALCDNFEPEAEFYCAFGEVKEK